MMHSKDSECNSKEPGEERGKDSKINHESHNYRSEEAKDVAETKDDLIRITSNEPR